MKPSTLPVVLDSDLAGLFQMETRALNQAVSRNSELFPEDFRFQLRQEEYDFLRSQNEILKQKSSESNSVAVLQGSNRLRSQNVILENSKREHGRGQHRKFLPFVFTERGVLMLCHVINNSLAKQLSIVIVRTFDPKFNSQLQEL